MNDAELAILKEYLSEPDVSTYLEFGAGNSTDVALSCENVKTIVTVETDQAFAERLRQCEHAQNGRLRVPHINIGETGAWGYPKDDSERKTWYLYSAMYYLPPAFRPDVILVDGRFRVATAAGLWLHIEPPQDPVVLVHDIWCYERTHYYHEMLRFLMWCRSFNTLGCFRFDRTAPVGMVIDIRERFTEDYR